MRGDLKWITTGLDMRTREEWPKRKNGFRRGLGDPKGEMKKRASKKKQKSGEEGGEGKADVVGRSREIKEPRRAN